MKKSNFIILSARVLT